MRSQRGLHHGNTERGEKLRRSTDDAPAKLHCSITCCSATLPPAKGAARSSLLVQRSFAVAVQQRHRSIACCNAALPPAMAASRSLFCSNAAPSSARQQRRRASPAATQLRRWPWQQHPPSLPYSTHEVSGDCGLQQSAVPWETGLQWRRRIAVAGSDVRRRRFAAAVLRVGAVGPGVAATRGGGGASIRRPALVLVCAAGVLKEGGGKMNERLKASGKRQGKERIRERGEISGVWGPPDAWGASETAYKVKKKKNPPPPRLPAVMAGSTAGVDGGGRSLDCRSFWKAGAHEGPSAPIREFHDALETGDFDRARVHPKFLHTNATSHKWAFGAISELLDNAVDEICNGATFIKVDKSTNMKDNSAMLVFQDDGGGMDPEGVRQCMSLGFSTKKSKTTIGQYGNGFKTSTMRLGADAIVFTRAIRESKVTLSIGLLSYTFLRRTMKDDIVVPMLDFEVQDGQIAPLVYGSQGDWDSSLKIILDWSPFSSKEELLQQFEDMDSHGTKVVIYNLWMNDDGLLELDFDDDDEDILLRDQGQNSGASTKFQKEIIQQHISHRLRFSLRAYSSILYLRKFENFQIILRGKPVEQINIANELKFKKVVTYKPQVAHDSQVVSVKVDIGFAKEAPVLGIFGINVYHKNRLIMPFWKVLQEASSRGRSVIGVLEANFIEPAHDKQDFERTPLFIRLETKLKQIIVDYWKEKCHLIGYQPIDPKLRSQYKAALKDSGGPGAKIRHEASTAQKTGGHLSNLLPQTYDDVAAFRLTANRAGSAFNSSGQAQDSMDSAGLEEDLVDIGSLGVLDPNCNEKLSEENLVLFTRREDLRQRDTQLRQTIGELEHELEETKRKCSQLAAELQLRKRYM